MNLLLALSLLILLQEAIHSFAQNIQEITHNEVSKRQLQACPSVQFAESYRFTYQQTLSIIKPTYTLSCNGNTYKIQSGEFLVNGAGLGFDSSFNIVVNGWQGVGDNNFYNVSVQFDYYKTVMTEGEIVSFQPFTGFFMLIIGKVEIQFSPFIQRDIQYYEDLVIDFSQAYDPEQPITANLQAIWSCPSNFPSCQDLSKKSTLTAVQRIQKYKMLFGVPYNFTLTMINQNAQYYKSITTNVRFTNAYPEALFSPTTCAEFYIRFQNASYPFIRTTSFNSFVFTDQLNVTDIKLTAPYQSLATCPDQIKTSNNMRFMVANQNIPQLFTTQQLYQFDSTNIFIITQSTLLNAFKVQNQYTIRFYGFLTNNDATNILGFNYHYLVLSQNSQTLFAIVPIQFIQVAKDKILYLDGSSSYDSRDSTTQKFNYVWKVDANPILNFDNNKLLSLTPDQRNAMGINVPGRYYQYSLIISDASRASNMVNVTVQVAPDINPSNCVTIDIKDINVDSILTYTIFPLLQQIKVTKVCPTATIKSTIWSCAQINWEFWVSLDSRNWTIGIEKENLQKLPQAKDIKMRVTIYYDFNGLEYVALKEYTLLIKKQDLIPIITFQNMVNIIETPKLIINASQSYDPEAVARGTTDIPVTCTWTCPPAFYRICQVSYGCGFSVNNETIISQSNYNTEILNNFHMFTLTLNKDSRSKVEYVFITIIESNDQPRCTINITQDFQLNSYAFMTSLCQQNANLKNLSALTYEWSILQFPAMTVYSPVQQQITNQQILRIPPYIFDGVNEILITVKVTNGLTSTPIAIYKRINTIETFTYGRFNNTFNTFTSYLTNFINAPQLWDSQISYALFFQYRMKESSNSFRILQSPVDASNQNPINTVLPPFQYEKTLYIDVVDAYGNYVSVRRDLISKIDVMMNPTTFAIRINNIINSVQYGFTEQNLENQAYRLQLNLQAYAFKNINFQDFSTSYFKTLCEVSVNYLNDTYMIDKRLNDVVNNDRKTIIRQHIIEALFYMTSNHRNLIYNKEINSLIRDQVLSKNYSIGTSFYEISAKAIVTMFQSMDNLQTTVQQDTFSNILSQVYTFMLNDEVQRIPSSMTLGMDIVFQKITRITDESQIQFNGNINISPSLIKSKITETSLLFSASNSTFTTFQIYSPSASGGILNVQNIPSQQAVNLTFGLDQVMLNKNMSGLLTFYCASREKFSDSWTTGLIQVISNDGNGNIVCSARHLSQYTLFIIDRDIVILPPIDTNGTFYDPLNPDKEQDQVIEARNETNITLPEIIVKQVIKDPNLLVIILEIVSLIIFVVSSIFFYKKFQGERNDPALKIPQRQDIVQWDPLQKKRCQLYRKILKQFNPYLNLIFVQNKFLDRWLRNALVQIYFMSISIYYIVIMNLVNPQQQLTIKNPPSLILFFMIIVIAVILIRPWTLKLIYKLFYEPLNKVDDYSVYSHRSQIQDDLQIKDIGHEEGGPHVIGANLNQQSENDKLEQVKYNKKSPLDKKQKDHDEGNVNSFYFDAQKNNKQNQSQDLQQQAHLSSRKSVGLQNNNNNIQSNDKQGNYSSLPPINNGSALPPIMKPAYNPQVFEEIDGSPFNQVLKKQDSFGLFGSNDPQDKVEDPQIFQDRFSLPQFSLQQQSNQLPDIQKKKNQTMKRKKTKPQKQQNHQIIDIVEAAENSQNRIESEQSMIKNQKDTHEGINELETNQMINDNFYKKEISQEINQEQNEIDQMNNDQDHLPDIVSKPQKGKKGKKNLKKKEQKQIDFLMMEGGEIDEIEEVQEQQKSNQNNINNQQSVSYKLNFNQLEQIQEEIKESENFSPQKGMNMNINSRNLGQKRSFDLEQINDLTSFNNNLNKASTDRIVMLQTDLEQNNNSNHVFMMNDQHLQLQHDVSQDSIIINPDNKKLFINRLIGKILLAIIWIGFILVHIFTLHRFIFQEFKQWVILSVLTFTLIQIVIDPILYGILALLMITPNNDSRYEFYLHRRKNYGCKKIFVFLFIGDEKMRDLRRRLIGI